jgi:hypothetical protein
LALAKAQRDGKDLYDVLTEYRDFGAMDSFGTSYTHTWEQGSQIKAIQRLEGVYAYFPTDWIVQSIEAAKDNPLLVQEVEVLKRRRARGYYDHYGVLNDKTHQGKPTLKLDPRASIPAHEFAHRIERLIPEIVNLEKEFYKRRTKGYPLIEINTIQGFITYPTGEKTRIDKFNHPYMGKAYRDAYELLSTGMEKLFYRQYTKKQDKDFDSFIIGLLLGVGYVHYNRKNRKRSIHYQV